MFLTNNILILYTDRLVTDSPSTLRGFIASLFPDNSLLHHHLNTPNKKGFIYTYPKVQYKIIDGVPIVLGIGDAKEVVKGISNIDSLNLKGKKYLITDRKLIEKDVDFGVTEDAFSYKFLTPWLALNEESYQRYKKCNQAERKKQLESILVGNIISMAKGLEYIITDKITATVNVHEVSTSLKGTPMLGFLGTFSVNFEIPDYWGIGKSVSRGFGTVKRMGGKTIDNRK
ncbi:MAG: CRISPR-associated endonuclease Cas6 [Candidatus Nitrosotenuis sp.]